MKYRAAGVAFSAFACYTFSENEKRRIVRCSRTRIAVLREGYSDRRSYFRYIRYRKILTSGDLFEQNFRLNKMCKKRDSAGNGARMNCERVREACFSDIKEVF